MIGLLDQNESLIDNKREIAQLQEQISLMSVHILNKREENEEYRDIIRGMCHYSINWLIYCITGI